MILRFIHIVVYFIPYIAEPIVQYIKVFNTFTYWQSFELLLVWANLNNVAMNICYKYFHSHMLFVSWGNKSRVAESCDWWMWAFKKQLLNCFSNGGIILQFHQQCTRVLAHAHTCYNLVQSVLNFSQTNRCVRITHCALSLHLPNNYQCSACF
jgi:hypothetical protein